MLCLYSGDIRFKFSTDDNGWCSVTFLKHENAIALGAEDQKTLLNRLYTVLNNPDELKEFVIVNDIKRFWCLTLSEKHVSFHLSELLPDDSRILFLFSADGEKMIEISLSKEVMNNWATKIAESIA